MHYSMVSLGLHRYGD